jgi:Vitamin K-dependent gamma-carboxylase
MKTLATIYNSIENFFYKSSNNTDFLSFFRIAVGLLVGIHFIAVITDFDLLFSSKSVVPQDIMTAFNPDWLITFPKIVNTLVPFGISEAMTILGAKILYITLSLFIIIGLFSRGSALLLLILQISLLKGSSFFVYGADFFTSMSLFYLILFPADTSFSVINLFRKIEIPKVNYMPIKRLFQIHISIAYFFSGLDKALGFNWHNGESIWKAINLPYANRDFSFDFSWMADYSFILIIVGWSTIIIEMCYPLFVWIPKTRKLWMCLTISMHIGIALVLNLYYFSAIMIIWNLSNFNFEGEKISFSIKKFHLLRWRNTASLKIN